MDGVEIEENVFVAGDAKLHGEMCRKLSAIVCKVMLIFPVIEAARPRSKSGIEGLCALHVALDKAKNLLQHCSECSKLYLAITGESILMKFEKARCTLQECLRRVEGIVPQSIGCKLMEIVCELEGTLFELDESEKQVGEEVITLLQRTQKCNTVVHGGELEVFHQAALKLGITSSRAALSERRALKKLIERARMDEDKRKESIVAFLLYLMRKYSQLFKTDAADDSDSQWSAPCSPKLLGSFEDLSSPRGYDLALERKLYKLSSSAFDQSGMKSGSLPIPPEEFRCPISLQLMYDPVIISSGQTYERACIEKWFNDGHSTCPKTQQQLPHLYLTPNYCVKGLITSWCDHNGMPVPDGPPESLDINCSPVALSHCGTSDSKSYGNIECTKLKCIEVVPLEESGALQERTEMSDSCCKSSQNCPVDEVERYESLLAELNEGNDMRKQRRAVEHIRLMLKTDQEARVYMASNGFVEALVHFMRLALDEGDAKAQEVGAIALFNLAIDSNRNKGLLLSAGIVPLLEQMIADADTYESATSLYLNLSYLDEAKAIIGSSQAVAFLVQLLQSDISNSTSGKHDALYTLFNISSYLPNIPFLLSSGIIDGLQDLLMNPMENPSSSWTEKALAIFINLASSKDGKNEIISTPGLISLIAAILETGELAEQEQALSCLLILCNGDDKCSHIVLQEGVIPALVSISVSGTSRGKKKAQKLLKLFREQRQREPSSPVRTQQQQLQEETSSKYISTDIKPFCTPRSRRIGQSLSSMWKNKNFPLYQC